MGSSGKKRAGKRLWEELGNVEPKAEVPLPANFSIHKLRALMQKWHTLLVLSGGRFVISSMEYTY